MPLDRASRLLGLNPTSVRDWVAYPQRYRDPRYRAFRAMVFDARRERELDVEDLAEQLRRRVTSS